MYCNCAIHLKSQQQLLVSSPLYVLGLLIVVIMYSTRHFYPQVAIYQITDTGLCDQILKLYKGGVNVAILVSARIVSYTDLKEAQDCYGLLYNNGMKGRIRKALANFSVTHQKYWIIDEKSVHLSTGWLVK